jgi:hydroxymethylbilane synthase
VATGSVRRRAQLADLRPDLRFVELRGNINTRLEKIPESGAIVMAVAALQVLGLTDRISEILDPAVIVPQVGQGAVAIECRDDDTSARAACAAIEHSGTRRDVEVERAFLAELGGGCTLPVGAHVMRHPEAGGRALALFLGLDGYARRWFEPLVGDELAVARAAARPFVGR